MIINKEGKLFNKISIIDIFVILAIAVLAFGLYSRFSNAENAIATTEKQQFQYTVSVKGIRIGSVEALLQGGPVTNNSTKEYAGEIVNVTYEESSEARELSNGTVVETTLPDRYNAKVTISVDGSVSSSGYYTPSNQSVNIGSTLHFTTKYASTSGTIIDVREVE